MWVHSPAAGIGSFLSAAFPGGQPVPLCPQSRVAALGSQVQARLEKRIHSLDAYVRRFQRLVGRVHLGYHWRREGAWGWAGSLLCSVWGPL